MIRYIRPDTPASGPGRDYAMLVRGMDRTGARINVVPHRGSFTPAQMQLYETVNGAQTETLALGVAAGAQLYGGLGPAEG